MFKSVTEALQGGALFREHPPESTLQGAPSREHPSGSHSKGGAGPVDLGAESPACREVNESERTDWCVTKGESRNGMSSNGEG